MYQYGQAGKMFHQPFALARRKRHPVIRRNFSLSNKSDDKHWFTFAGKIRDMNYFELFDIPVALQVPSAGLSDKYFALQKKYHPDRFAQAPEADQLEALELSSQVNKGFRILKNPEETIRYVLQLKGLLQEEEKYELSPAFLMEMMELNELVMEADGDAGALQSVTSAIDQLKKDIYEPVKKIMANYQEGVTSEEELLQVKEYYFKKKYLDRLTSSRA